MEASPTINTDSGQQSAVGNQELVPFQLDKPNLSRLIVVIHIAVDRGRPKDTLKPSGVGGLGIEGEARCGPAK